MATEVQIYNLALMRLGEDAATATTDDTVPVNACETLFPLVVAEALDAGPEKGWRFARRSYAGIDVDSITIASIANSLTSGDITITGTHSLVVGDMVELTDDTGYDDTYDVTAISTTATFDVTATFVATGTGTAYWTSEEYARRFAIPTLYNRLVSVNVGGIELTDWVRRGIWILTNLEDTEVDIHYIYDAASTVTNFPAHFVDVVWRKLAIHLAYSLVQSRTLVEQLVTELETIYLPRAIAMDARGQYVKEESHSWTEIGRTKTTIE